MKFQQYVQIIDAYEEKIFYSHIPDHKVDYYLDKLREWLRHAKEVL